MLETNSMKASSC